MNNIITFYIAVLQTETYLDVVTFVVLAVTGKIVSGPTDEPGMPDWHVTVGCCKS